MLVVLAKAFANPQQNIHKCSKRPFRSSHPVLKNVYDPTYQRVLNDEIGSTTL